jgi:excisionase family DNA binding protein
MTVRPGHDEPPKRAGDQPLTINEIATLLGVSKMTVYRLVEDDKLRARRIGRSLRVDPADLTAFLGADCLDTPGSLLTWIDPNGRNNDLWRCGGLA